MESPSGSPARPETARAESRAPVTVGTETLELGSPRRRRPALVAVAVALAVLLLVGLGAWRFWPRPVAPLTLTELEGVYAGMVRADGVNDASVFQRRNAPTREVAVTPADCVPLFDTTAFNQFPAEAIDGVGTYWMGDRLAISLVTMRFADTRTAARAYDRVEQALSVCAGTEVAVTERRPTRVRLDRTTVTRDSGVHAQTGYVYSAGTSSRFAVHVLQFENTVTWQFRFANGDDAYAPLEAQRLMDSLMSQTRAVLALRPES